MSLSSKDYAWLSFHSYKAPGVDYKLDEKDEVKLDGIVYKVVEHMDRPSGYQGTIYQRVDTGEIVVAHRGTEFSKLISDPVEAFKDLAVADVGMVATRINVQRGDAMELTQRALEYARRYGEVPGNRTPEVTITGHSLGGLLGQVTAHRFGLRGEMFNPYGAPSLRGGIPEGGDQVINHVTAADSVSSGALHYGQVRVYATPRDIELIDEIGRYRNDPGQFDVRRAPAVVTHDLFGTHGMHHFLNVDEAGKKDLSVLEDPSAHALAAQNAAMIAKYRADIGLMRETATQSAAMTGQAATLPITPLGVAHQMVKGAVALAAARETADQSQAPEQAERVARSTPLPGIGAPLEASPGQAPSSAAPDFGAPFRAAPTARTADGVPEYLVANQSAPNQSVTAQSAAAQPKITDLPPVTVTASRPTQTPDHPAPTPDRSVAVLQAGLIQLGYHQRISQPLQINGNFDDATRQAVTAFQAQNDLPISGSFDAATQQALQQRLTAQQQAAEQDKTRENERRAEQAPGDGRKANLLPYNNPDHPQHALYAEVKTKLEGMGHQLPEERLHQIVGQMDLNGMRAGPQNQYAVRGDNNTFYVVSDIPGFRAHQNLGEPIPQIEQTMQQVKAHQQTMETQMNRAPDAPDQGAPVRSL
jgi:hypothetical protein